MRILNIVSHSNFAPLGSLDEIVALQERMGSRECAFLTTINPESPPFSAKIAEAVESFLQLKEALSKSGISAGILVQTSLGHSERSFPRLAAPFQRIIGLNGQPSEAFCPLDGGFVAYVAEAITMLASTDPGFILIDDDFQLFAHRPAVPGCFCPLHLDLFNRTVGTDYSREELALHLARNDAPALEMRRQWLDLEYESLLRIAKVMRESIDQQNPSIPCGLCSTRHNLLHNAGLAKALAGKNQPFVRVGGNVYLERSAKDLPLVYNNIARQIKAMPEDVEVLSEADTFPHHHYSVSATALRAHLVSSLVVGCHGAKAWVLPTSPGLAHRNEQFAAVYQQNAEFMAEVQRTFSGIRWQGVSVERSNREAFLKPWNFQTQARFIDPLWALVFGRLSIAHIPGGGPSRVRAFSGEDVNCYDDAEWEEFFSGCVLLDGLAARILTDRGFSRSMGVRAVHDDTLFCSSERYTDDERWNGEYRGGFQYSARNNPGDVVRLQATSEETLILGKYIIQPWRCSKQIQEVAPSVVCCENAAKGKVAVFAAGLDRLAESHFINPGRRRQLRNVLSWLHGETEPFCPDIDTDVYFLQGCGGGGRVGTVLFFLNLQADTVGPVSLSGPVRSIGTVERLSEGGQWIDVSARVADECLELDLELRYLDPVIVRL